jgi:glycerophosphoryl diester phosphodiesterase
VNALALVLALSLGPAAGFKAGAPTPTSDVSNNRVTSTGSTTARALRDWMAGLPFPPSWGEATYPLVIAHRGTRVCAPENTLAAFDYAAAFGLPIETDVQTSRDGALFILHDDTVDRTTDGTGNAAAKALDTLRTLDASQDYFPSVFGVQRIPTFEEFLIRYGRTHLLAPEDKATLPANATAMAEAVVRHGLQRSVLIQSFNSASLAAVAAVDPAIRTALLVTSANVATTTPASVVALGAWGVSPDASAAALDAAWVAAMHAAGLKVITYTTNTVTETDRLIALGVDAIISDDPAYVSAAITDPSRRTSTGGITIPVPTIPGSGWVMNSTGGSGAGDWLRTVASGYVTWDGITTVANDAVTKVYVSGARTADLPAVQTFVTNLKLVAGPTSGDATRYIGLRFCWTTDSDVAALGTATSNGYWWIIRVNGTMELHRVTAGGSLTSLAAPVASAAISVGQVVPVTVAITATTITVTRTDTGASITANDATHPRGGFFSAFGSGAVPGIGATTVTY